MDEDEAHCQSYLSRMKESQAHHKKEHKKLHQTLRVETLGTCGVDDAGLLGQPGAAAVEPEMATADDHGRDDDDDSSSSDSSKVTQEDGLFELRRGLYTPMQALIGRAERFQQWLSAVHAIASIKSGFDDDKV
jgi:hypothetical protein